MAAANTYWMLIIRKVRTEGFKCITPFALPPFEMGMIIYIL